MLLHYELICINKCFLNLMFIFMWFRVFFKPSVAISSATTAGVTDPFGGRFLLSGVGSGGKNGGILVRILCPRVLGLVIGGAREEKGTVDF